jgi:regulator of protease activity HflC (stomatin/prohibitin superfamily)
MSGVGRIKESAPAGAWGQAFDLAFRFLWIAACAIALGWSVSNIREIPADSQALVLRFGSVVRQQTAGLLLAWPAPIERVTLLPAAARQLPLHIQRFDPAEQGGEAALPGTGIGLSSDPRENSGFVLAGDASLVHLEATLFYQIVDPEAYMLERAHVRPALERLFVASAVSVCAGRDLDTILVARPEITLRPGELAQRARLRADIMEAVNGRLEGLARRAAGLGVRVSRIDLSATIPAGAKQAFDEVLTTKQGAEEAVAKALTEAQLRAQQANQEKDRILAEAKARAEETVARTTAQTAPIAGLARTAGTSRPMLLQRLYFDRVGQVLRQAGAVEAVDPAGSVRAILPGSPP